MKTVTKKLLFILILVISIMAIIITANQIYDVLNNEKVIDNNFNGIVCEENKVDKNYGIISQEITIQLYEWNENATGLDINDYLTWVGNEKNDSIYEIERTITTNSYGVISENLKIKLKFGINKIAEEGQIVSVNTGVMQILYAGDNRINVQQSLDLTDKYEEDENGVQYIYSGEGVFEINISSKSVARYVESSPGVFSSGGYYPSLTFYLEGRYADVSQNDVTYGENPKLYIDTNELLQVDTTINEKKLSEYIYEQLTGGWSEGKELATLKCSIGEYYEYDVTKDDNKGSLAISTQNNDLPMLFNNGDIVIPYIAIANGTEPLSIKSNGRPKMFQVTQIRPYFDGAFWQELQLQEVYSGKTRKEYVFESGDSGGIVQGYDADPQTIVFTEGKIIDVQLTYDIFLFNILLGGPVASINEEDNSFTISNVRLTSANSSATLTATITYEA